MIYREGEAIETLQVGECTIHRASGSSAARWWQLWFHVLRDSDGQPEIFCVPVAPNGSYSESGPGGRTWGLTSVGHGVWQISPSINVLDDRDAIAGTHEHPSLWHQTPQLIGATDKEVWALGGAP